MQMENIATYIAACRELGVPDRENFMTVDLYEGKNLGQVVQNILVLKRETGHGGSKGQAPEMVDVHGEVASPDAHVVPSHPREERTVQSSQDVSRVGPARRAGKAENTKAFECCICTKFITSGCVAALDKKYHTECFNCKRCGTRLLLAKYYELNKQPYCDRCILIEKPQSTVKTTTRDKGFKFG